MEPSSESGDGAATLERAVALRRIAGLEDLEPELLTTLAARTELRRHAAGESLAGAGNACPAIHLVLEGSVLESGAHGPERRVRSGGLVGDLGALFGESGSERAIAAEDAATLALPLEDLIDLCEEHFPVLLAVLRAISRAALSAGRREDSRRESTSESAPAAARAPGPRLSLGERVARLAADPLFSEMAVHTLGRIAQDARPLALASGDPLWSEGDAASCVAVVLAGTLGGRGPDGDFEIGRDALVGLQEALAGVPRIVTLRAAEPVTALILDVRLLLDAMEDDPEMAIDVLAGLARTLAQEPGDPP